LGQLKHHSRPPLPSRAGHLRIKILFHASFAGDSTCYKLSSVFVILNESWSEESLCRDIHQESRARAKSAPLKGRRSSIFSPNPT
jgi:hypothetical protein